MSEDKDSIGPHGWENEDQVATIDTLAKELDPRTSTLTRSSRNENYLRSLRRKQTFAQSNHQWGDDYKERQKQHRSQRKRMGWTAAKIVRSNYPVDTIAAELNTEEPTTQLPKDKLQHVNGILDYLGYPEGQERNSFLRSFNRNLNDRSTYEGVDIVRTGWHIALFYGATDNKEVVKATVQSVGINGARLTDSIIQRRGTKSVQDIVKNYSSLRVNGLLSLVPTRDLGCIISAMKDPSLGDVRGPTAFMRELGFTAYRLGRTPILYFR